MDNTVSLLEIAAAIYVFITGLNMFMFKSRQKDQILAAIPDQAKAAEYGKKAGITMLIAAIVVIVVACVALFTGNQNLNIVEDLVLLVCLVVVLMLNKKYSGKYTITIF